MTGFRPLVYRGMIVIAGHEFPVNSIRLRNGKYEIVATGYGPLPEFINEPITIFGEDGQGVAQGGLFNFRATGRGEHIMIIVPLRVTSVTAVPADGAGG